VVIVLVVGGLAFTAAFERELLAQVDARLNESTEFLDEAVTSGLTMPREASANIYVQAVDEHGALVFSSPPLAGRPPMIDVGSPETAVPPIETVAIEGYGSFRVASIRIDGGTTVIFGTPLQPTELAVSSLNRTLFVALPALAIALGVVVWFTVGRTLRPVRAATAREQRLVADASHEFRSPLAGVRALLESESQDPSEIERNRVDALHTLARLEAIADDLLILSREGGTRPPPRPVDLDEVVLRQARLAQSTGTVAVRTAAVSAGQVLGYESDLERLVDNLLTNAVRHATSTVDLHLGESAGWVELTVRDDGPGIPESERLRVFERFTRLDEARDRRDGGVGLGLSIVRSVAVEHGGTVEVDDTPAPGASIVVRLPASVGAG